MPAAVRPLRTARRIMPVVLLVLVAVLGATRVADASAPAQRAAAPAPDPGAERHDPADCEVRLPGTGGHGRAGPGGARHRAAARVPAPAPVPSARPDSSRFPAALRTVRCVVLRC